MHRALATVLAIGLGTVSTALWTAGVSAGVIATGDFNGDGFADLAIGAPGEDIAGRENAGAVNIIYGSSSRLSADAALDNQFFHEGSTSFPDSPQPDALFGSSLASGDFDNDGFDDLAIGAPRKRVNGEGRAGAVYVISGSANGLDALTAAIWHQDSPGIRGGSKTNDAFGSALASADFDDDGYDDLAIGAPNETVDGVPLAGGVAVFFGSGNGIRALDNIFLTQNSAGIDDSADYFDHFGAALCTGDFNGDGFADLAISSPDETIDSVVRTGIVHVVYGDAEGFDRSETQLWSQESQGVGNRAETQDHFGSALASGDFDDDGFDDLAIGVSGEDTDEVEDCGLVHVLYGRTGGLKAMNNQIWQQNGNDLLDDRERDDHFGAALAAGDFNADGYVDLAIGVPGDRVGQIDEAGSVTILFGGAARLSAAGSQYLHQNTQGVVDKCHEDDAFGGSLAVGDFDGNGRADLACGVSGEDIGESPIIEDAGAVHVLYGTNAGVSTGPDQLWSQDSPGIRDNAEEDDGLGGENS